MINTPTDEEVLLDYKRAYARAISLVRTRIMEDTLLAQEMDPQVLKKVGRELARCATAFVLKTDPWRYVKHD